MLKGLRDEKGAGEKCMFLREKGVMGIEHSATRAWGTVVRTTWREANWVRSWEWVLLVD